MAIYLCDDDRRRIAVQGQATLNGIDYLEVLDQAAPPGFAQRILNVSFVKTPAPSGITKANVQIAGGERITNIQVQTAALSGNTLVVQVDRPGDYSEYTLRLVDSAGLVPYPGLDPVLSEIPFSFKVECPTDFDCAASASCVPSTPTPPEIDYLAKDFSTFVTLMRNRISVLSPRWRESSPADIGVTLVELLAYVADRLSYRQDAVATEAYLATARQRISVRRHARLVDYVIQEGCNARAWVCLGLSAGVPAGTGVTVPAGTELLTRIPGAPVGLPSPSQDLVAARQQQPQSFQTMTAVTLFPEHGTMSFHNWGGLDCCLPKGATGATLRQHFVNLRPGDVLVFQETRGRTTGNVADADPSRRVAVRLTSVTLSSDPLGAQLVPGAATSASGPLDVTEIAWSTEDALPFSIQITQTIIDPEQATTQFVDAAIARGNVVLADHGRAVTDSFVSPALPWTTVPPHTSTTPAQNATPPPFAPQLTQSPLTYAAPFDRAGSAAGAFVWSMGEVLPAIQLTSHGSPVTQWTAVADLLGSGPEVPAFVVEIDNAAAAHLRFGDDEYGQAPDASTPFTAGYRVGNGTSGNVGAGAISHIVGADPSIVAVENPIAASGGVDPESIEHVRKSAPFAFRTQLRAVTEADYANWLDQRADVQRAAATFRWTGSWYTVFNSVERLDEGAVDDPYRQLLESYLEAYRVVGKDLEVDVPRFVPLDIAANVCVKKGYFRGDVEAALDVLFSSRPGGVFDPAKFDFGQTVYLSPLYAAAQSVDGVDSIEFTKFEPRTIPSRSGLSTGAILMGRLEIARVANDPSYPERGTITFTMLGGQ